MKQNRQFWHWKPAAALLVFLFVCTGGAAPGESGRYLFLFDISFSMARIDTEARQAVGEMIRNGLGDRVKNGDTFGFWTFNEQAQTGFPLQTWNDDPLHRQVVTTLVETHLKRAHFEKTTRFDRVWPEVAAVVQSAGEVTVLLVSDGDAPLQGTPFDAEINAAWGKISREMRQARRPIVTTLTARAGKITGWLVNSPTQLFALPEIPAPKIAVTEPAAVKTPDAPPPAPVVVAPKTNEPPAIVEIKTPEPALVVVIAPPKPVEIEKPVVIEKPPEVPPVVENKLTEGKPVETAPAIPTTPVVAAPPAAVAPPPVEIKPPSIPWYAKLEIPVELPPVIVAPTPAPVVAVPQTNEPPVVAEIKTPEPAPVVPVETPKPAVVEKIAEIQKPAEVKPVEKLPATPAVVSIVAPPVAVVAPPVVAPENIQPPQPAVEINPPAPAVPTESAALSAPLPVVLESVPDPAPAAVVSTPPPAIETEPTETAAQTASVNPPAPTLAAVLPSPETRFGSRGMLIIGGVLLAAAGLTVLLIFRRAQAPQPSLISRSMNQK